MYLHATFACQKPTPPLALPQMFPSLHLPHHNFPSTPIARLLPLFLFPPLPSFSPSLHPFLPHTFPHCSATDQTQHSALTTHLIRSSYCTCSYLTQIFAEDQQRQFVIAAAEAKGRMTWSQALMRSIPANILICTSIQMGIAVSALTQRHRKGKGGGGERSRRLRLI